MNRNPTIALSAHWHTFPQRTRWIVAHGFAAEYTPNPEALDLLPQHVKPLLAAGVPVRYHGFFPRHEFGHANPAIAESALKIQTSTLEAMHGLGEQVITIHVGLDRDAPLDHDRVLANLSRLVIRARELGITVCLENLRRGPTSNPDTVLKWARASGAMITLDIGHAISCECVQRGELSALDFVETFAERLFEVHMYERETDHQHHPPKDMNLLGPIVDRLLATQCRWWTIELNDPQEALTTRALLLDYLSL